MNVKQKKVIGGLVAGLGLIVLAVVLSSCGTQSPVNSSDSLNLIAYASNNNNIQGFSVNSLAVRSRAAAVAETGSQVESSKIRITSLELKKDDGSYVTVYSGDGSFVEMTGTGEGTVAGTMVCSKPPVGTYTGIRARYTGMTVKAKVRIGGTLYYTKTQSIDPFQPYTIKMSTAAGDYGTVTFSAGGNASATKEGDFPTALVVTESEPVNLVWIAERNNAKVEYVAANGNSSAPAQDNIGYITAQEIATGLLPYKPAKKIQFSLTATKDGAVSQTNAITLYLDATGRLLGASCARASGFAINSANFISGTLTNMQNNGNTASFDLKFGDGDNQTDTTNYYEVTGSYDCGAAGTTGTYSGLTAIGVGLTPNYESEGYTLTTSGSDVTSTNTVL